MSTQLSKTYESASVETEALRVWNDEKLFHGEPTDPGKPYSIVIPPPNVTAALHLGHALNNTLQDILTRWHRMLGDNAVWLPGTDHAGIATQTVVEKRVLAEEGKRRTDFAREEFVARIQAWKDQYEQRITEQLKRMGCSCDWDRQAFTMDEPRARAVREAFFQLFKDGLIYRGKRLVNWDPATQTALADDEVEMEEIDGHFYYLRYPLVEDETSVTKGTEPDRVDPVRSASGTGSTRPGSVPFAKYVTVATTRPETMLGDTAVAINPKDPRAAALRGKKVRLPIVNRVIPIIEDEYVVLPDANSDDAKARYATGFLKVTPAHDPNDYDLGRKHNLPTINVMAPDGSISDQHGWSDVGDAEFVLGLDRYEAREAIVEWFRTNKLLEDVKPYRHTVGHSYRSHVAIEPYLSDQWYLKVTDERLAGAALRAMAPDQRDNAGSERGMGVPPVHSSAATETAQAAAHGRDAHATNWEGKLRFYPARYAKTFQTWHENIRDWCISRQLWWGHRIPVWSMHCDDGGMAVFHLLDQILPDTLESILEHGDANESAIRIVDASNGEVLRPTMNEFNHGLGRPITIFICLRSDIKQRTATWRVDEILEREGFTRDPDVLDTWFSSGLWPLSTLCWPDQSAIQNPKSALNVWNPTSVLTTAREIITLWVSRMVMFNLYFLDRLPYSDVFIHAMIQDGEGRKMSKSLGNGVDPLDIIESHGADAMRFTLCHMTTQTQDVRMPVEKNPQTGKNTSPKFDIGRNFCNKMWNAARFALMGLEKCEEGGKEQSGEATKRRSDEGEMQGTPSSSPSSLRRSVASSLSFSLFDRWILSRLSSTIDEVNEALKSYRFDAYAKACYDFFWRDLCDWYIEAIKPAMRDAKRAASTSAVLAAALDGALRIMHPVVPFITETLFWKLNEVRPERTLAGVIELGPSNRLINAAWPRRLNGRDEDAERIVPQLQEIIGAIRNLRNEHKVDPKRVVNVSVKPAGEIQRHIEENREIVELLATCKLLAIDSTLATIANAAKTSGAGCEIFVESMADEAAEQQRLAKRREELTKSIAALKGRLANESYIAKAPPHLVEQTKDQLAAAEKEMSSLK